MDFVMVSVTGTVSLFTLFMPMTCNVLFLMSPTFRTSCRVKEQ